MKLVLYGEPTKAVRLSAGFEDFKESKFNSWQSSFFSLCSWQNTWGLAYNMGIREWNTDHGRYPYAFVTVKEDIAEKVKDYMEALGYANIQENKVVMFETDEGFKFDEDGPIDGGEYIYMDDACIELLAD